MYRGGDLLEALHGSIPEWLLLLAALVTRLGDVWVVIGATIAASWLLTWHRTDRGGGGGVAAPSRGAAERNPVWPVGIVVGGLAAMTALKYLFTLPRPDQVAATPAVLPSVLESAYVSSVTLGGYGFPSGHALGATVAYGILALTLPVGTRRIRLAVAGVVALSVSLSRVVLSVHYPGDIVAGIAIGVGYLVAVQWLLERSPIDRTTTAFGLALGLAVVAIAVSGAGGRSVTYAALAAGGLAVWTIGRPELRSSSPGATYHAESATAILGLLVVLVVLDGGLLSVASAAVLGGLAVVPAVVSNRSP
ncbi:phosphatase PAP2 family protein [Natronolimnohabitans sp. A-GB9]|uniref:phosphatase PAP2 family protein n=1 Tax=Natronolimnohabitans sp. A-GB9 TaxID=3069757 RepID=UPI0027B4991B|nr:phosphatase PAP2 family protein [Natronolimnohabitans sp. A-GB9]MDQ2050803.1 phosphatase PAP2 family protein [Natronolimnohabitans sp. A-GB9]